MALPHKSFSVREKSFDLITSTLTDDEIKQYFTNRKIDDYEDVLMAARHRYVDLGESSFFIDELIYLAHSKRNK
jgi:hypothetical protein